MDRRKMPIDPPLLERAEAPKQGGHKGPPYTDVDTTEGRPSWAPCSPAKSGTGSAAPEASI